METTLVSIYRWTDKEDVLCVCVCVCVCVYTEWSSTMRKKEILFCDNFNEPRGHYAKWNKSDRERQTLHGITYIWNLKKRKKKKVKLIETESRMVVWLPGAGRLGKWRNTGQRAQTSSYKINIFWGSNVQHGDYH